MSTSQFTECQLTVSRSFFRFTCLVLALTAVSNLPTCEFSSAVYADDEIQKLRNDQEAVAGRYSRFERLLSQMADMLGREDPERAELLRRAINEGREQAISGELKAITESLNDNKFGSAREQQGRVARSMQEILTLLQSEDRRSEVEKERERLNELLKDIRNLTARQKAARAATQNARSPSSSAPDQQQALKKADEVLDDVKSHDKSKEEANSEDESSNGSKSDSDSSDQKNVDGGKGSSEDKPEGSKSESENAPAESLDKDGDTNPKEPSSEDNSSIDGESDNNDPTKPEDSSDQKQKEGQPSSQSEKSQQDNERESGQQGSQSQSGQPQNGEQKQQPPQQTPGRQQLEEARQAMQEAIDQLKKQQRDGALKEQDDAISKLQEAQEKLEETLKQLREEEKEMVLAALEARFQRMLSLQTQIYEETVAIGSTPRKDWLNTAITRCRELGQEQSDLTRECSLTVGLLREDGTSVSILIAVEDIETDMKTVSGRLQQTKAFELTQSMQTDVIEALRELIETAQKEMEEMKQEERQQQQQQSRPQQKSPLVELMAEIKVLRSLQLRVNRRTATVNRLQQQGDPNDQAELLNQIQELAVRQNRLTESAGELARQMEQKR